MYSHFHSSLPHTHTHIHTPQKGSQSADAVHHPCLISCSLTLNSPPLETEAPETSDHTRYNIDHACTCQYNTWPCDQHNWDDGVMGMRLVNKELLWEWDWSTWDWDQGVMGMRLVNMKLHESKMLWEWDWSTRNRNQGFIGMRLKLVPFLAVWWALCLTSIPGRRKRRRRWWLQLDRENFPADSVLNVCTKRERKEGGRTGDRGRERKRRGEVAFCSYNCNKQHTHTHLPQVLPIWRSRCVTGRHSHVTVRRRKTKRRSHTHLPHQT